jgi:hypothetical protein
MIMSQRRPIDVYEASGAYGARRFKPMSGRGLLAIWAVLSSIWALTVAYDVYHRVTVQADMSRDVERDLDDVSTASCVQPQCTAPDSHPENIKKLNMKWSNIASTYIKFGSVDMAASAFGPPLVILVLGFGWIVIARHRRRNKQNCQMIDRGGLGI